MKLSHEEKHKQCLKEIKATLIAVALCALWHIGTAFILNGKDLKILHMPAWFVVSVGGVSIISIVSAIILVKYVFVDFDYDDGMEGENE
ncbi:MAG: YhdT family protein [Sphaerochaetaceae bacterium]|nr:YhdT family protein [Sphaerochaetaceae bacterium]